MGSLQEAFLRELREYKGSAENTVRSYRTALEQFGGFLGEYNIKEVDESEIKEWMMSLNRRGMKATTINLKLTALKQYFDWLYITGKIDDNPIKTIQNLRVSEARVKYLNERQVSLLISEIRDDICQHRFRNLAIIKIMLSTGCRINVIHNLNRNDIDLENKTIQFYNRKSRKEMKMPLSDASCKAYSNYLELEKDKRHTSAFNSQKTNRISTSAVRDMVKKYLKRVVDNPDLQVVHALRHTCAMTLALNGVPARTIQKFLGHTSIENTMIYINALDEEVNEAVDILNGYLK